MFVETKTINRLMTTPNNRLLLCLIALTGITAAAMWALVVIELNK